NSDTDWFAGLHGSQANFTWGSSLIRWNIEGNVASRERAANSADFQLDMSRGGERNLKPIGWINAEIQIGRTARQKRTWDDDSEAALSQCRRFCFYRFVVFTRVVFRKLFDGQVAIGGQGIRICIFHVNVVVIYQATDGFTNEPTCQFGALFEGFCAFCAGS